MDTQSKKTVLLIRNANPADFGGAETYQVSLATILSEIGYKPVIVTRSVKLTHYAQEHAISALNGWWWSRQNWSGRRLILFPAYVIWQGILFCWYLNLIRKTKADVLHIQSKDDFIAGTLAGRLLHKKVVWTDHMDLRYVFLNITKPFRNPVGKLVHWAQKYTDRVILISENEYRLVTSHFKHPHDARHKISIVKNGVIDRLKVVTTTKKDTALFTYCIASRIVTNKGIGEAIQAFQKLSTELPEAAIQLAIYGDGPETPQFKDLAANNKNIQFLGHQNNSIKKIFTADVFMLPSYQEGFSIALLEATMLGKAIIASNVDSNPEIIAHEQTGLLVNPRSIDELKEAMKRLYTEPALKQALGLNARESYEKQFNLKHIVEEHIIPLYEQ